MSEYAWKLWYRWCVLGLALGTFLAIWYDDLWLLVLSWGCASAIGLLVGLYREHKARTLGADPMTIDAVADLEKAVRLLLRRWRRVDVVRDPDLAKRITEAVLGFEDIDRALKQYRAREVLSG